MQQVSCAENLCGCISRSLIVQQDLWRHDIHQPELRAEQSRVQVCTGRCAPAPQTEVERRRWELNEVHWGTTPVFEVLWSMASRCGRSSRWRDVVLCSRFSVVTSLVGGCFTLTCRDRSRMFTWKHGNGEEGPKKSRRCNLCYWNKTEEDRKVSKLLLKREKHSEQQILWMFKWPTSQQGVELNDQAHNCEAPPTKHGGAAHIHRSKKFLTSSTFPQL